LDDNGARAGSDLSAGSRCGLVFWKTRRSIGRVPPPLQVTPSAARRFLRRTLGLDEPFPDVATALVYHGYAQIDPINVCGRMHDLILRNRVRGYREGDLMRHLHGEATPLPAAQRSAFEHHLPDSHVLVAFPLDAWPHLLGAMRRRTHVHSAWSGKLTPRERALADQILAEIAARGPLLSAHFSDDRRARRVWGAATLAKSTLQKLFFHGRVLIARRDGVRRLYDLPERVLPAAALAAPEPSAADTARWLAVLKLRQRRLVILKREELRAVEDLVQPVAVENCPPLYCLREDAPLLNEIEMEKAEIGRSAPPDLHLLAPLDPLIYDRRVTAALWDFDYTWEVYTPPHKRVRGYYALPVLAGDQLVGHVDPKADREKKKLRIVSRSIRRGHRVATAVKNLATFLGLRS
jgi:uncharacterized protein YcaQ